MAAEVDPAELVQLIVWFASQRGEKLTPIRVVKFLYLTDLYHARRCGGQTLTGWPWRFVHYGPYCSDSIAALQEAVQRRLITATTYQSKYDEDDHETYSCEREDEPPLAERLPIYVASPLKAAVKRWADNTAGLLDHVYFETEPMLDALPSEALNFSKARETEPEKPLKMQPLSRTKIRNGRELVDRLRQRYARVASECRREEGSHDAEYWRAVESLEGDPLQEGLTGEAEINVVREREEK